MADNMDTTEHSHEPPSIFAIVLKDGGIVIAERVAYFPPAKYGDEDGKRLDPLRGVVEALVGETDLRAAAFDAEFDRGGFGITVKGAAGKRAPVSSAAGDDDDPNS